MSIEIFTKNSHPDLYKQYLRLKFEVFVKELGWSSLPHSKTYGLARPEKFDDDGLFVIARHLQASVGVVRGIIDTQALPHQQLFEHHLLRNEIRALRSSIGTINALAVSKEYRGKHIFFPEYGKELTIGERVMMSLINEMAQKGARIIFLTSDPYGPASFFRKLGFYILDSPFSYSTSPTKLINMGLVVSDKQRFIAYNSPLSLLQAHNMPTKEEYSAIAYFKKRDVEIGRHIVIRRPYRNKTAPH